MNAEQALHMVTVLRGRGYVVEIEGEFDCRATIRTENGDQSWSLFAPSTEAAVEAVARELFAHLSETVEAMRPLLPELPAEAGA